MASFNFKLADGNSLPGVGLGVFMMEGPDCVSAVLAALAAGYRHIDTAQSYNNEAAVGEGLKASGVPRESVYITTKLWPGNPNIPTSTRMTRQELQMCFYNVSHRNPNRILCHQN